MRKLPIILSVLLAALLTGMIVHMRHEAADSAGRITVYRQQLEGLQDRRLALRSDLQELDAALEEAEEAYVGEVSLFVDSLGQSEVYDELFPVMESRDMPGVLVLTPERLPGLDGCMSEETFRELLDKGWSYSLYWNGENDLDEAISEMESLLGEAGMSDAEMLWSAKVFDFARFGDTLRRHGIAMVAAPSFTGAEDFGEDMILAVTARLDAAKTDSIIADSLSKGFGTAFTLSPGAGVNEDDIAYVLDKFAVRRSEEALVVGGSTDFWASRAEREDERMRVQDELLERMREIQEQIDALDDEIAALRDAYFPDN